MQRHHEQVNRYFKMTLSVVVLAIHVLAAMNQLDNPTEPMQSNSLLFRHYSLYGGHPGVNCSVWVQTKPTDTHCLWFSITAVRTKAWPMILQSLKSLRNITNLLFYAQISEHHLILLKEFKHTHNISLQWKAGHPHDHLPFKRTIKTLHAVFMGPW